MSKKRKMIAHWKYCGLISDNYDFIFDRWDNSKKCELCKNEYKNSIDKHMEHNHDTGEFRNIVCRSCNFKKKDVKLKSSNTSGFKNICWAKDNRKKEGGSWVFQITINSKTQRIKGSKDKDWLIEFAKNWYKENNYYT